MPVIWCVKQDELKSLGFDTSQYSYALWEAEEKLKEKLRDFILATAGGKP